MTTDPIQVFAVIPAAGVSARMGRPKQLLPLSGGTMLESVIDTVLASGLDGLCVVTHPAVDEELALSEDPRFVTAINGDPRSEMLDSVLIGMDALGKRFALGDNDGILVCPGDAAEIAPNDVQVCAGEYRRNAGSIAVAAHDGRRGHPIVFPVSLEADLREHPEGGLRALLDRRPTDVRLVDCAITGVLTDIDTPEDYARLSKYRSERSGMLRTRHRMTPLQITSPRALRQRLFDQTPDALRAWLTQQGEPAYRADQILDWAYRKSAQTFEDMTNLSKSLRQRLADSFHLYEAAIAHTSHATDGVAKMLLRWADGETTECVSIPAEGRRTACISTQVGCPVGCVFCASGIGGVRRNLSAGQIVEQAMIVAHQAGDPARLSNIVFMGMGEPLANYDATVQAVRTINADWGLGIGARKITLSTVGLPKQMKRLADEGLQVTLALSLHAPNDALRRELIPWAEGVSIDQLVDACRYYFDETGREVTLEYVLLHEINDRLEHAGELAKLAKDMRCNINLIQYNPVEGLPYGRPTDKSAHAFLHALRDRGINTHLRASRGLDVDGACGQLRRRLS